jgi:H/ACA ribonucleoprotein complex subunit 1
VVGEFSHACKDQALLKCTQQQWVAKFNRPVMLDNKTEIGKVDEILGPINNYVILSRN